MVLDLGGSVPARPGPAASQPGARPGGLPAAHAAYAHAAYAHAAYAHAAYASTASTASTASAGSAASAAAFAARAAGPTGPAAAGAAGAAEPALLYERVVALIEQLIAERGLAPGDRLPSYTELAELGGVSMITVRRALDELERAGRIRRHQGVGTFVAPARIVSDPGRTGSLLGTLASESGSPARLETRVLELRSGEPSGYLRDALRLRPAHGVWRLRRLRLLDGMPAVLETSMIPIALAPELDRLADRLAGSLYDLLASEYGLADAFEEQYLEVIGPTRDEARLLALRARAQAVRIRGMSSTQDGIPFDCFEQLYSADQFAFALSGSASRRLLPVPGQLDWSVA